MEFKDIEPIAKKLSDKSAVWQKDYKNFRVCVYKPFSSLKGDILNYGFMAPYLVIFAENILYEEEMIDFAEKTGLAQIAKSFDSSVVFVEPLNDGKTCDWDNASDDILSELISNSRIHQYYKDGYVVANNRFTKSLDGYFIRGAIFRLCLFGCGKSADFIARNYLTHFEGDGLWGRSDLAPATCFLENLSVVPENCENDIPVVSYKNSDKINDFFAEKCDYFLKKDDVDFVGDFYSFAKKFRRMNGPLQIDKDLEKDGLVIKPHIFTVKTSADNLGDDKETENHKIGAFAFYNKDLFDEGKKSVPLVLGFHGGGDSCFFFSTMAGWANIAHKNDFLLVTIENHLNSTATEMIEVIEQLKKLYKIDQTKIYASGFSMGGCKTWDFVQEYPEVFAAVAPMDATFDVGQNVYGQEVEGGINEDVSVPIFYAGGEITHLPELPFQAQKCLDRMAYALKINNATAKYDVKLEDVANWKNKIWGIDGDFTIKTFDNSRNATLTMELFKNNEDKIYNIFASISEQ
ncbi:MAG: hypothetical protein E7060_06040, partial [Treponema bryantii]|nr:hypothetical protein [Treponema bryantii]